MVSKWSKCSRKHRSKWEKKKRLKRWLPLKSLNGGKVAPSFDAVESRQRCRPVDQRQVLLPISEDDRRAACNVSTCLLVVVCQLFCFLFHFVVNQHLFHTFEVCSIYSAYFDLFSKRRVALLGSSFETVFRLLAQLHRATLARVSSSTVGP